MLGFCWGFGCKGDQGGGPHPRTLVGFWGVFVGLLGVLAGVLAWVLLGVGLGLAWGWLAFLDDGFAGVWLGFWLGFLGVWLLFWLVFCLGVGVCLGLAELWLDVWMGCG